MIKGKQPEEIRKLFNIQNDFTPEEEAQIRRENVCRCTLTAGMGRRSLVLIEATGAKWHTQLGSRRGQCRLIRCGIMHERPLFFSARAPCIKGDPP